MIKVKNINVGERVYKQFVIFGFTFRVRNKRREQIRAVGLSKYAATLKGNHIYLVRDGQRVEVDHVDGLNICFRGSNSVVEIGADPMISFVNSRLNLQNDGFISIGSSCYNCNGMFVDNIASGGRVIIGENMSTHGVYISNYDESDITISIGDDCMMASNIFIRASDGHAIYDINTKKIVNCPDSHSVKIGDHVWLGQGARVIKNCSIASNTIVGNGSIVTKRFDKEFVALAGVPAKVVKEGVNWDRRHTGFFENNIHE